MPSTETLPTALPILQCPTSSFHLIPCLVDPPLPSLFSILDLFSSRPSIQKDENDKKEGSNVRNHNGWNDSCSGFAWNPIQWIPTLDPFGGKVRETTRSRVGLDLKLVFPGFFFVIERIVSPLEPHPQIWSPSLFSFLDGSPSPTSYERSPESILSYWVSSMHRPCKGSSNMPCIDLGPSSMDPNVSDTDGFDTFEGYGLHDCVEWRMGSRETRVARRKRASRLLRPSFVSFPIHLGSFVVCCGGHTNPTDLRNETHGNPIHPRGRDEGNRWIRSGNGIKIHAMHASEPNEG